MAIGRAEVGLLHARLSRSGGHSLDDSLVTVAMHLESQGEVYFKLGMHGAAAETWTAALKLFEAKGMSAWAAQVRGRVAALPGARA